MQQKNSKEQPHHIGHRDRLRQRFVESGADALQDYEILELILFTIIPRRDVKPLAKTLLTRFGTLPALMNAKLEELESIDGLGRNAAIALKATTALAHRAMKREVMQKPLLNTWARLLDYCQATLAHEAREHFRVIFVNVKNELISDETQGVGTINHAPVYPREIIRRALELGASALVLLHNHPSGDLTPSRDDIDMTQAIIRAAEPFAIKIHDHLIVSKKGYASFKTLGLL